MIGYYAHHVGRGHVTRGLALAARSDLPVTGLGSMPRPPGWSGDWVELPRDDDAPVPLHPTRSGSWHWLPSGHAGFTERMRVIGGWIGLARPSLLVSDVSVEVLALGALLGVRTAAVVLHGRREDRPHRLAFETADVLIGPWPESHRQPFHEPLGGRLHATGAFGLWDGRVPAPLVPRRVVAMVGGGPHAIRAGDLHAAAGATRGWDWHAVGLPPGPDGRVVWHGWRQDPWDLLSSAEIVVSTAGDGSLAQIAAARRPAVLLPQERPFDEQLWLARSVSEGAPVALVVTDRPEPEDWPGLLGRAAELDGERWCGYLDGSGAERFARVLETAAA